MIQPGAEPLTGNTIYFYDIIFISLLDMEVIPITTRLYIDFLSRVNPLTGFQYVYNSTPMYTLKSSYATILKVFRQSTRFFRFLSKFLFNKWQPSLFTTETSHNSWHECYAHEYSFLRMFSIANELTCVVDYSMFI